MSPGLRWFLVQFQGPQFRSTGLITPISWYWAETSYTGPKPLWLPLLSPPCLSATHCIYFCYSTHCIKIKLFLAPPNNGKLFLERHPGPPNITASLTQCLARSRASITVHRRGSWRQLWAFTVHVPANRWAKAVVLFTPWPSKLSRHQRIVRDN